MNSYLRKVVLEMEMVNTIINGKYTGVDKARWLANKESLEITFSSGENTIIPWEKIRSHLPKDLPDVHNIVSATGNWDNDTVVIYFKDDQKSESSRKATDDFRR